MPERRDRTERALLLAAALAITGSCAAAQQTFLPVGDLLCERGPREAYLPSQCPGAIPGGRRLAGEGLFGVVRAADEPGGLDTGVRGQFAPDRLLTLLVQLGHEASGAELHVLGRFLCLPRDQATAAARRLAELRAALPPRLAVTAKLLRRSAQGEAVLLSRTTECDPGRLSVLSAVRRHLAVVDFGVEIACPTSIANPSCGEARDGVMIALRPHLAPSSDHGLLELVVRSARPGADARIDTGYAAMGPIDRLPLDIAELARVVPIHPGSHIRLSWSAGEVDYALELDVDWRRPQQLPPGGRELGIFTAHGELRGFRSLPIAASSTDGAPLVAEDLDVPWLDLDAIAGADAQWMLPCGDEERPTAHRFVAADEQYRNLAGAETAWFEARRGAFVGELTCFAVPRGRQWPADGRAPDGATRIGATLLQQADGTWSAATVREEHSVLNDWHVEMGCYARIADPGVARLSTGLVLNTYCQGDAIEVEGGLSRIVDAGRQRLHLSAPLLGPEMDIGDEGRPDGRRLPNAKVALVADEVFVEHPLVAQVPVHFVRRLAPGEVATWRTAADAVLGEGQDLVVVVVAAR